MTKCIQKPDTNYCAFVEGWHYHLHSLDSPAENFGHFTPFINLWRKKLVNGRMPRWADFDFYDFTKWHGRVMLLEIKNDPFDLHVRLFGTTFVECYKEDLTGINMSERRDETPELLKEDLKFYRNLCDTPSIGCSYGHAHWIENQNHHYTLIELPLANDGENVSHILCAILDSSPENPIDAN